ncbi:MAG: hypothetical protein HQL63_10950 [Magnetococcales bacterium]|nr:hypothetical protein [Magnetococcales bacterium]MBF0323079.1 hypothetical protein [Magnetococcales bacterium]
MAGKPQQIVQKHQILAEVTLTNQKILKGTLYLAMGERLLDFMNRPEGFIVVVDKKKPSLTTIVNKSHVTMIREMERTEVGATFG